MPRDKKNMFATQCSNPDVAKANIGKNMPRIFPVTSRAAKPRNMDKHTSAFAGIPLSNDSQGVSFDLSSATPIM